MNILLRNVLVNYISTLTEREFDIPLLCILFKNGFYDIHFTHGSFEFGKDFIAKKNVEGKVVQYAFQSKGGNVGVSEWGNIRWQIEEGRINPLSHPSFDTTIHREIILVLTGRLVGGANLSAQQYNDRCIEQGEIGFTVWDIDTLVEMMVSNSGDPIGLIEETPELLAILAKLKKGESNYNELEIYSRCWIERCRDRKSSLGIIFEATILMHELILAQRLTLASYVSLFPIRALVYALNELDKVPNWIVESFNLAENQFVACSKRLYELLEDNYQEDETVFNNHVEGVYSFVTYPVICSQLMEILSLLGLLQIKREELSEAERTVNILDSLLAKNSI